MMGIRSRRRFVRGSLALAGLGLLTGCGMPFPPGAQRPRLYRIGFLAYGSPSFAAPWRDAFCEGLLGLGYVEGENFVLEERYANGDAALLPGLAAELVAAEVEVILTGGTPAIQAVKNATSTIPVVFGVSGDPVTRGFVASLARPGGNITGLTQEGGQESAKRLELLKEAFPPLTRVAVLWDQSVALGFQQTAAAAQTLGLQVLSLELNAPNLLASVLATALTGQANGLAVQGAAAFPPLAQQIVGFALQNRLPAMYATADFVAAGALLTYTTNFPTQFRRAATYVDKILKGAKPADLPVETPTRWDFVVNLKTAGALGLTIPQSVLDQATQIIR
jgi:putative ABC transport system substrate-binding protein